MDTYHTFNYSIIKNRIPDHFTYLTDTNVVWYTKAQIEFYQLLVYRVTKLPILN